ALTEEEARQLRDALPSSDEYFSLTVGGGAGAGWLSTPCKFTKHIVKSINDIRRRCSSPPPRHSAPSLPPRPPSLPPSGAAPPPPALVPWEREGRKKRLAREKEARRLLKGKGKENTENEEEEGEEEQRRRRRRKEKEERSKAWQLSMEEAYESEVDENDGEEEVEDAETSAAAAAAAAAAGAVRQTSLSSSSSSLAAAAAAAAAAAVTEVEGEEGDEEEEEEELIIVERTPFLPLPPSSSSPLPLLLAAFVAHQPLGLSTRETLAGHVASLGYPPPPLSDHQLWHEITHTPLLFTNPPSLPTSQGVGGQSGGEEGGEEGAEGAGWHYYTLSPSLLTLLQGASVATLPPGARALMHVLDFVYKSAPLPLSLPRLVSLLALVLQRETVEAALGEGGREGGREEWVQRAAMAMPLMRVMEEEEEEEGGGREGGGEGGREEEKGVDGVFGRRWRWVRGRRILSADR
ncbi:Hypothetical protein NocV09_11100060, partial [Nannochloropsis oceanica]